MCRPTRRTAASPRCSKSPSSQLNCQHLLTSCNRVHAPSASTCKVLSFLLLRIITLRALFLRGGVPTHFESAFLGLCCICLPCWGNFLFICQSQFKPGQQACRRRRRNFCFALNFNLCRVCFRIKMRIRHRDRRHIGNRMRNGVTLSHSLLLSLPPPTLSLPALSLLLSLYRSFIADKLQLPLLRP